VALNTITLFLQRMPVTCSVAYFLNITTKIYFTLKMNITSVIFKKIQFCLVYFISFFDNFFLSWKKKIELLKIIYCVFIDFSLASILARSLKIYVRWHLNSWYWYLLMVVLGIFGFRDPLIFFVVWWFQRKPPKLISNQ